MLPQPGELIDAKYQVDRLLAQGGMGAVYAATHIVSGKRVALKWMLPAASQLSDATERFIREARATARIDHPNVVDIYDVGSDGVSVYLVMELLQGETLHERLARAPLSPTQTLSLLMPALRGVAAAHAHGVIHRDLKPDNIFLCQGPHGEPREPKVVDFGISKIAESEHARDQGLTQSGVVMGTPYYMSPEQVRGAKELDERGDIYAFGVILYEMLAGQRPFQAETYNQLILKIVNEDPVPLLRQNPAIDPRLAAIVERAMARLPEARFGSIEALALALEPYAGGATFHLVSFVPGELAPAQLNRLPTPGAAAAPLRSQRPSARGARGAPGGKRWLATGVVLGILVSAVLLWRAHEAKLAARAHLLRPAQTAPAPARLEAQAPPPSAAVEVVPPRGFSEAAPAAAPVPALAASPASPGPASLDAPVANRKARHDQRAARSQSQPAAGLAADWDERLPTSPSTARKSAAPPASAAGRISRDELR